VTNRAKKFLATGAGTGYLPVAPGTWGSAAVAGIFLAVAAVSDRRMICVAGTMVLLAAAASIVSVALGRFVEAAFGRKDPAPCTVDEWAGQAVALIALPLGNSFADVLIAGGVGFLAFRVFDIVKPPPIRQLEKLPLGWGVLADDLAAGVYANIVAQLVLRLGGGL